MAVGSSGEATFALQVYIQCTRIDCKTGMKEHIDALQVAKAILRIFGRAISMLKVTIVYQSMNK